MSGLHDRLRRQRRDPPRSPAPEAEPPSARELPDWLRRNLGTRAAAATPNSTTDALAEPRLVVDEPRDLADDPAGWCARTRDFGVDHRHGDWPLGDVLGVDRDFAARFTGDDALFGFDFRRAVYLDIEATGLSGGAGTIPFLVALGTFQDGRFRLWQGFLRGPETEAALLSEVARRVRASSGVVSFFGKSYDRHRLEDKMRLHGIEPPFDAAPHLDLYHPLARLVKGTLPDAKLQRLERELCGVTRADDLPGSFAPAAWFDFLRRRPHRLEDVFRHNEDDVLSLVVLAAHLGCSQRETRADGTPLAGCAAARARALAGRALARDDAEAALEWSRAALERQPSAAAWLLLARAERGLGSWRPAADAFRRAYDLEPEAHAAIEEAKLAEHRLGDTERALAATRRALAACDAPSPGGDVRLARLRLELEHRLARLERRR